jgi:hypothetical protein
METLAVPLFDVEVTSPLIFSLQALLVRHEAYIADSERERKAMTAHIEALEMEKQALEQKNACMIEENRNLLDQLEEVNNAVVQSDAQVTSLQATLLATQQELQRLSYLAARTERLEHQLADFEREQLLWQTSLAEKEEAEKSAVRRWQQAERTLAELQEQMERIEKEAREERERHVEVVSRMERRHEVEKELNSAAGRLKGAAAAKNGRDPGGTTVVSHFVKDILQDNANLQLGIVELREMLQNSNDEVETLRRQLLDHQPANDDGTPASDRTARQHDLRDELQRAGSQELHVHHHYHAAPPAKPAVTVRRPKKKRYGSVTPNHFTPPASGYSTPRSSVSYGTPSSVATILQQTAVSVPQQISKPKRLSTQSAQTTHSMLSSSGPGSPQSATKRTSSIFDRVFSDAGQESSRPTTPDTEDPGSPIFAPTHSKRASASSWRTFSAPNVHRRGTSYGSGSQNIDSMLGTSVDAALALNDQMTGHDAIPEENEGEWQDENSGQDLEPDSNMTSPLSDELLEPLHTHAFYQQPLRRAASHESLLSVHGMDIHTLKSRPSQLLTGNGGRSSTSQAVISEAHAQARPAAMSRPSIDSGRALLSGMAAERCLAHKPSLGAKVGGWVFGRWGATPTPTKSDDSGSTMSGASAGRASSRASMNDSKPATTDSEATPKKVKLRPPGINQPGPIFGFPPEVKQQHAPIVKSLDAEGLREALGERSP